jgi:hypothetical protein
MHHLVSAHLYNASNRLRQHVLNNSAQGFCFLQVHHLQLELASCQDTCDDLAAAAEIDRLRLTTTLANAERERDSALTDLAGAYSDMQAMQAALLDSALYVRYLRAQLVESRLDNTDAAVQGAWGECYPLCVSEQMY